MTSSVWRTNGREGGTFQGDCRVEKLDGAWAGCDGVPCWDWLFGYSEMFFRKVLIWSSARTTSTMRNRPIKGWRRGNHGN